MVEERNTFITTMKTEIYRKEYRNDTERVDLNTQIHQKDAIIKKLEVSRLSFAGNKVFRSTRSSHFCMLSCTGGVCV